MVGANIISEEDSHKSPHPKISACVDCKRLKVKCVRSIPDNSSSPCMRCIKKGLQCITLGSLKRNGHGMNSLGSSAHRNKKRQREILKEEPLRNKLLFSWRLLTARDDLRIQLLEKYDFASFARPHNNAIKMGILTEEQVLRRFDLYREFIYPNYPFFYLPKEFDYKKFMAVNPVLFHTVLDISSVMISDEAELEKSIVLHNMVLRTVIDEIMVVSVKSIELLKCLVLLSVWYNESELYHQQRLHVLTTLASSVSYDLGMGGVTLPKDFTTQAPAFEQMVAPQADDAHNIESYKVWLAVYSMSLQSLMANRIPQKIMWNKYTREAIKTLKMSSQQNKNKDIGTIAIIASLRHLQETIIQTLFKKDNEPHPPDFSDPSTQQLIHQFEVEIENMEKDCETSKSGHERGIMLCNAFLHQGVLYTKYNGNIGRAPFTNFSLNLLSGPLSYQAVASFTKCFQYSTKELDKILLRPMAGLAGETTNFWSTAILACDILMKCRTCCIFNRYYAAACFVKEEDLGRIVAFISLCDTIIRQFPDCNNAISSGFFIKLILCHHDARVHYHTTRIPVENQGDPEFVEKIVIASANVAKNSTVAGNSINTPNRGRMGSYGLLNKEDNTTKDFGSSLSLNATSGSFAQVSSVMQSYDLSQKAFQQQAPILQSGWNSDSNSPVSEVTSPKGSTAASAPVTTSNSLATSPTASGVSLSVGNYQAQFQPQDALSVGVNPAVQLDVSTATLNSNSGTSTNVSPASIEGDNSTYQSINPYTLTSDLRTSILDESFVSLDTTDSTPMQHTKNQASTDQDSQHSSPFSPFGESHNFNVDDGVQRTMDIVESRGGVGDGVMLNFDNLDDIDSIFPRNVSKWEPNTFWTLFTDI